MQFLKTRTSAKAFGLSLVLTAVTSGPAWAEEEASFKSYKVASAIGENFVFDTHRCAQKYCYWKTARVLEDLRYGLFELGHEKQLQYPTIDTTELQPWVVHERGADIHLTIGEITAVDVEHFKPTDKSSCPFEAQIKYKISQSGPTNPIAEVVRQIFEADNQTAPAGELYVTMRECFKQNGGEWKQTRWGYYLRES